MNVSLLELRQGDLVQIGARSYVVDRVTFYPNSSQVTLVFKNYPYIPIDFHINGLLYNEFTKDLDGYKYYPEFRTILDITSVTKFQFSWDDVKQGMAFKDYADFDKPTLYYICDSPTNSTFALFGTEPDIHHPDLYIVSGKIQVRRKDELVFNRLPEKDQNWS